MMDTLSNDPEDGSLQKKKVKKFRLFGKKKSQPAQLDPNCPQCNPHLLVALEQQQRQQQLYLQQQQQLQYHQQLQQQRQLQQQQQMLAEAEASRAGRRHARRAMDDSPGAIVEDYGDDDDDDEIKAVASSSTPREGGASAAGAAASGARVACDCHRCQQARSERQLTVELLPMDTQVPLQNMMQDAAVLCALL